MSIFTVTISGVSPDPEVYGGITAATSYVGAVMSDAAAAWRDLGADDQKRTLVMATRYIDELAWQGVAAGLAGGVATALQWPRSGITNADGSTLDSTNVPTAVIQATQELAMLIAEDPDVVAQVDTGTNIRSANAGGGVGVEFFNPQSARNGSATTLPTVLQRLIGKYLAALTADTVEGGFGAGGSCESSFSTANSNRRYWPY